MSGAPESRYYLYGKPVEPVHLRRALTRAASGLETRYPDARRLRMRIGGVLLDYVEIRPRDLTTSMRVIVRRGSTFEVAHVVELWDAGSGDHLGGRYRYRVASESRWRYLSAQSWVRIVVDG